MTNMKNEEDAIEEARSEAGDSTSSELERLGQNNSPCPSGSDSPTERGIAKTKKKENAILKVIDEACALGSNTLDLACKGMRQFPSEILEMPQLEYLYLESNELTSIPDELFDKLPNLKWLDLRRNYLVRLPSVYTGRHQALRNLLLEGNNLRTLPLELGLIKSLNGLNISNNPLEFPPQSIVEKGTNEILKFLREMIQAKSSGKLFNAKKRRLKAHRHPSLSAGHNVPLPNIQTDKKESKSASNERNREQQTRNGREKMKGPKDGEVSDPSSHEEQNNNVEISTQLTECDSSEMNNESRTASHLSKMRETHLAKRRDQLRPSKMPELSEMAEKDDGGHSNKQATAVESDDAKKSNVIPHPEPNGEVLPCIPDEFLKNLRLSADDSNSDELSEQEIESKFASLSLAFKTDAQTLEKRLEIQERSRDIAEQNVDKELQSLRTALSKLNQICTDPQVREVLSKIQNHIDILEKASARVSSRAEVFGAIQQEKRLSKAVDIMVHHVENIHRVHEKEHAELEEARKLLQDSRSLGPSALDIAGGDMLSRRSASVCPNSIAMGKSFGLGTLGSSLTPAAVKAIRLMKPRRRVSEIALPKVLGGSGAPNLHPSPSMFLLCLKSVMQITLQTLLEKENVVIMSSFTVQDQAFEARFPRAFVPLRSEFSIDEDEGNNLQTVPSDSTDSFSRTYDKDPRSRFQAVVASTTVKSAIANTLRRTTMEKHNNVATSPTQNESPQVSRNNSTDSTKDVQDKEKQKNLEEEAFKKGYEQGMRANLGQDLSCLREQQNQINESLGDIMDNIDNHMEEPKGLRDILQERFQDSFPKVQISSWRIRLTMSCFLVVMAFLSILMSLFPVSTAEVFSYKPLGTPPM